MSINVRSREFPNTLTKMLASQQRTSAAALPQDDGASTLVEILDKVSRLINIRSIPFTDPPAGLRGSEYGTRNAKEECSTSREDLWLTDHPTTFFHTLGQHLEGGQHPIHFWRVRGCLERSSQWETCANHGTSHLHS